MGFLRKGKLLSRLFAATLESRDREADLHGKEKQGRRFSRLPCFLNRFCGLFFVFQIDRSFSGARLLLRMQELPFSRRHPALHNRPSRHP